MARLMMCWMVLIRIHKRIDIGIDAICHVASPFHFKPKDNEKDLLLPAIQGTIGLLESALKFPSIKRIVVTSTMATISNIGRGVWPGKVYTVCL
jgi:nucleoside-diphosphate-sugar epimerase